MKVVLASKSPRRKEILSDAGFDVEVDVSGVDEDHYKKQFSDLKELTKKLAEVKALAVAGRHKDSVIVAADTLVSFEGEEIGQQKSDADAHQTLKMLSGKEHQVISGIYVMNTANNKTASDNDVSVVRIKEIPEDKMEEYISSGLYKGKAGAYNIDDPEFESYVERVDGSFTNIKGLPIEKVKVMIKEVI